LNSIGKISNEIIDPKTNPDNLFNYIELANINETIGIIEDINRIFGKDAPSRAKMYLREKDIIASSVQGSIEKIAIIPKELEGSIGSTGFFVFRPFELNRYYFLALMKNPIIQYQMKREASGTILAAVSPNSLKNILIPDISLEKQNEIANLTEQSHQDRKNANDLFLRAIQAIDVAIDNNENTALEILRKN